MLSFLQTARPFTLLLFMLWGLDVSAQKQTIVHVADWGIQPNVNENITPLVKKMLDNYQKQGSIAITFPPGMYNFWPDGKQATTGFIINNMRNVTINGNGASFIFHGVMKPFLIRNSGNITLKNFSVDWQRPFISQGEIVNVSDDYLDLKIDAEQYPYRYDNGTLVFYGDNWENRLTSPFTNLHTLYDKKNKEIVYRTRDNPLGNIFLGRSEEIAKGVIRFYGKPAFKPEQGTYVTLYHGRYITPGIEISRSSNTTLNNLKIYHALSHGILGEKSENISIINTSMTINEVKGRVFSIVADASHFTNCKGKILVDSCAHAGMGDDFINCHGVYVKVLRKIDSHTLEVAASGRFAFRMIDLNDELFLVDSATMQRQNQTARVASIDTIRQGQKIVAYRIKTNKALPVSVRVGYFLENKTWSSALELRNCRILKRHRARGILVSTPQKVVIENNYFRTAGAAILIEGDLNYWYESGANNNVLIRNNIFEDCLTSGPEWGEAVINITPSVKPLSANAIPYHRNIRIENNTFKHYDSAILYARSVDGLVFSKNTLTATNTYLPFSKNPVFYFDGCRKVRVSNNTITGDIFNKKPVTEHMNATDIDFLQ